MNLLELQQRANILVQKVNEYEASLTGTTIDETNALNQHIYADLYCLRPVMKLLFGATADEKLNRTLDNDVALRAFSSSAPANNTTFNLLSYRSTEPVKYSPTLSSGAIVTDGVMSSGTGTIDLSGFDFKNTEQEPITFNISGTLTSTATSTTSKTVNLLQLKLSDSISTTLQYYNPHRYGTYFKWYATGNAPSGEILGILHNGSSITGNLSYTFTFSVGRDTTNKFSINLINWSLSQPSGFRKYDIASTSFLPSKTMQASIYSSSTKLVNINDTYIEGTPASYDVEYKTSTHDFVQNIDMMNSSNMLQLDVQQNIVTDRDTRIKQGINYSYSSNIADALVTESQVANIFKWNTTSDIEIKNNTRTINRQVPGIVCYYLGNDYNGKYTATIPYAPRQNNLNSVNYSTPSYYGAFYRTDDEQSQIGLYSGNEACRIFMPGMNYTRGKLESPQQIWQPDKLVGEANKGLGYNWQGQAVYHELVFKNRRSGATDNNVDFIPGESTVPDNDPQGLATRVVLAQQKPFYHNRPWFNELNELFGVNTSKLADFITDNSIIDPQPVDVIKPNTDILTVNNITITDGIMSDIPLATIGSVVINKDYNNTKYKLRFTTNTDVTSRQYILYNGAYYKVYLENGQINYVCDTESTSTPKVVSKTILANTEYDLEVQLNTSNNTCEVSIKAVSDTTPTISSTTLGTPGTYENVMQIGSETGSSAQTVFKGTVDLTKSNITVGSEVTNLTVTISEIPRQFNKKDFTVIGSANLSNDGILTNTSDTAYITADIENFNSASSEIVSPIYYIKALPINDRVQSVNWFSLQTKFESALNHIGFKTSLQINSRNTYYVNYSFSVYGQEIAGQKPFGATGLYDTIQFKITSTKISDYVATYTIYAKFDNYAWLEIASQELTNETNFNWTAIVGQTHTINDISKIDVNPFTITNTENNSVVFESSSIPGKSDMDDESFYKNYKLDYETWAKALDKPL